VRGVQDFADQPIRERIAFGGPFVMNDQSEIAEAFRDFHAGRFGEVRRIARLRYDR
jgi:quercetin 2,3-dioxygenase